MGFNFGTWTGGYYFPDLRADVSKFIELRPSVKEYLSKVRKDTSTKVFLLTNSGFDYTNLLLNYAFGTDWQDSFDVLSFLFMSELSPLVLISLVNL